MRQRLAIIIATAGFVVGSGFCVTAASASTGIHASVTKRAGLAGYYFTVSKTTTALRLRGSVKVPTSTCGKRLRSYSLQIGAGFTRGGLHEDAIVVLMLNCKAGTQGTGTAQLVAGYDVSMPATPIKAGQVVRIIATVTSHGSFAKITYANGASAAVWGPGGRPTGADYALTLPNWYPPRYSAVTFSGCTVNKKKLSAFHPNIWESVTTPGAVDGRVSTLTGGTGFTISY